MPGSWTRIAVVCIALSLGVPLAAQAERSSSDVPRAGGLAALPDGRLIARGELVVGLADFRQLPDFARLAGDRGAQVLGAIPRLGAVKLGLAPGADERAERDHYRSLGSVRYAEFNAVGQGGELTPNDTSFPNQWHLQNTGQNGGTPGADIDMLPAWNIEQGDDSVVVAVLDTGIDFNHPEFLGRMLPGHDYVNEDADPSADHPHGIFVTGLLAANADNRFGIAGVDRRCTVLPVKVLDAANSGTVFDLAQGIDYAAAQQVDVISMSLINYPFSSLVVDALAAARQAGAILVACGGNLGIGNADVTWPGGSPDTLSIGWTDADDERASQSGTGSALDFVAPGDSVWTTSPAATNSATTFSGCSAATPVAAGIISLLLAQDPDLTQAQVYAMLQASAEDQVGPSSEDTPGWDPAFGHGRLNAHAALALGYQPLAASPAVISASAGGVQVLELNAGAEFAGRPFLVLGSITGTEPPTLLGGLPIPLVLDFYFFFTIENFNAGVIAPSFANLDEDGRQTVLVNLPPIHEPEAVGLNIHHAYMVFDPTPALLNIKLISNPSTLTLDP